MSYFKVVDNFTSEVIINTNEINYNLTLINQNEYHDFLNFITFSSNELDLPLDFYVSLNNNIANWGNAYIQSLPKSINRIYELFSLTNNPTHKEVFIREDVLVYIIESINKIGFKVFNEGFYLWEYIFEMIRVEKFPYRPSRKKSFFLFLNLSDCDYYMKSHQIVGKICRVDVLETQSLFKADMNIIDIIPNGFTFKQTAEYINDYWNGKISSNPIYEYLFQGTCILKFL